MANGCWKEYFLGQWKDIANQNKINKENQEGENRFDKKMPESMLEKVIKIIIFTLKRSPVNTLKLTIVSKLGKG